MRWRWVLGFYSWRLISRGEVDDSGRTVGCSRDDIRDPFIDNGRSSACRYLVNGDGAGRMLAGASRAGMASSREASRDDTRDPVSYKGRRTPGRGLVVYGAVRILMGGSRWNVTVHPRGSGRYTFCLVIHDGSMQHIPCGLLGSRVADVAYSRGRIRTAVVMARWKLCPPVTHDSRRTAVCCSIMAIIKVAGGQRPSNLLDIGQRTFCTLVTHGMESMVV